MMKGSKKCLIAGLVTSLLSTTLTGCGEVAPTLTQEQQFQLEMAKVQANKEVRVAQEQNRPDTIVYQDETPQTITVVAAPQVEYSGQYGEDSDTEYYEEPQYEQRVETETYPQTTSSNDVGVSNPSVEPVQSGHSTGDVLLGAAAGAVAGYAAGSILNNGHREYTDSNGSKFYLDRKGNKLTSAEYEEYKRKNPTLTKAREVTTKGQSKAGAAVQKAKGKVSNTYKRASNSNTAQSIKAGASRGRQAISQSKAGQYVSQKAKKGKEKAKTTAQVIKQKYKKAKSKGRR